MFCFFPRVGCVGFLCESALRIVGTTVKLLSVLFGSAQYELSAAPRADAFFDLLLGFLNLLDVCPLCGDGVIDKLLDLIAI